MFGNFDENSTDKINPTIIREVNLPCLMLIRVKASKLGATTVEPVTPAVTSLFSLYINVISKFIN